MAPNNATVDKARFVGRVVAAHRKITAPVDVRHLGHLFRIFPNVFSPFLAPSGYLSLTLASWPIFKNKRILDVGCGAGVFTVLSALSGAIRVVGIDINPHAVENARTNVNSLGCSAVVEIRLGDLFDSVHGEEQFDIIFADLPFTSGDPADYLERAFFDTGLSTITRFVDSVPELLRRRGGSRAFLCLSDLECIDPRDYDHRRALRFRRRFKVRLPGVNLTLYEIRLREPMEGA